MREGKGGGESESTGESENRGSWCPNVSFFYVYCFDKGVSEMINLALRQELKSNQGINKLEVYLTHCLTGQLSLEKEETDVYASTKRKEMYKKCEIALSHTHTRMPIHPHTHAHLHEHINGCQCVHADVYVCTYMFGYIAICNGERDSESLSVLYFTFVMDIMKGNFTNWYWTTGETVHRLRTNLRKNNIGCRGKRKMKSNKLILCSLEHNIPHVNYLVST
uniref:Uncharacterized protein n=1 Tax=Octopus bimaculoides TaxID=37653 RepID=A0A0L8HCH5_OCTBM